jgi:hypothetical protein
MQSSSRRVAVDAARRAGPGRSMCNAGGWAVAALLVACAPAVASAQGVIDWQLRTQLSPDALAAGAAAAFQNPAAGRPTGRLELLAADLDVPTGVRGVAVAGACAPGRRISFTAGYQNLRIDDIDRTTTSPLPDAGGTGLDVSEHVFAAGTALAVTPVITAGAGIRYTRIGEALGGGGSAGGTAGVIVAPRQRFSPRLGGTIFVTPDRTRWAVGGTIAPVLGSEGSALLIGYGVEGESARIAQRVSAGLDWRGVASLTGALLGEPEAGGRSWQPAGEARVQVRRYGLGFVHERLANGFGGLNTFQLTVRL